jgi:hypothetical protein
LAHVRAQVTLAVHLAAHDPALHPDATHLGVRLGDGEVDVGAQGVQGHTALAVLLGAGDLGAVQTAAHLQFDAFGAHAHGTGHGHLHGAAEADAAFQLAGDAVGHEAGVQLRALDLEDVDLHVLAGEFLQLFAQLVHFGAALADDHAGARGVDGDGDQLQGALDHDLAHAGLLQAGHEVLADLLVLHQFVGVVVYRRTSCCPSP